MRIVLLSFLISFSTVANDNVYKKVQDYNLSKSMLSLKEKMRQTKSIVQQYPNSITAYVPYMEVRASLPSLKAELESNKKPVFLYLKERMALSELGYDPSDMAKKEKIWAKLEALTKKYKSIFEEGTYDLYKLFIDKKKRHELAKKLYEKKKNNRSFTAIYATSLPKENKKEIVDLCSKGLSEPRPHTDYCWGVPSLLSLENIEEDTDYKSLLELLSKVSKKESKEQFKIGLFKLYLRLDRKDLAYPIGKKINRKNKKWFPHPYYRDVMKLKNFDEYVMVRKIGEVNRMVDFNERVKALESYAYDESINKNINYYALSSLASAYTNPAFNKPKKALNVLDDALRAGDKSFSTISRYVTTALKTKARYREALRWLEKAEQLYISKDQSNDSGYYDSDAPFQNPKLETVENRWHTHFMNKGKIYKNLNNKVKAYNSLVTSYSLKKSSEVAYLISELTEKDKLLESTDWAMRSFVLDLSADDDKKKKREERLGKMFAKSFSNKLKLSDALRSYSELYKDEIKKPKKKEQHPLVGKKMLTRVLKNPRGENYDWANLNGKNVIVSFWATWCTPCFQEMAVLNKMAKDSKFKDIKIIGVCTDGLKNKKKVKKILKKADISYDIVLSDGALMKDYKAVAIPANFFVNKKGKVFDAEVGYSPDFEKKVKEKFTKL